MDEQKEDTQALQDIVESVPFHQRKYVVLSCLTILIVLVVVLGFAYGSARVCSQVDGILDGSFVCHPNYNTKPLTIMDNNGLYIDIDTYNKNIGLYNISPNRN